MSTRGPPLEGALGREVKNAQDLLNSGKNSACISECKAILSLHGSQLDEETQADVQMMLGRAAVLEKAWEVAERAYSQASRLRPGAAEGWEGLMGALEGFKEKEKEKQLLEPLLHLATVAEEEGNWSRSRSLRLRAAIILSSYKERKPEALRVLTTYLQNAADVNVEDANPQDRLEYREVAVRASLLDEDDKSCLGFACQALDATKKKHRSSLSLTPLDAVVSLDMAEELLERLARIDPSKFLYLHETYVSDGGSGSGSSSSSWTAASEFMSLMLLGGGISDEGRNGVTNTHRFPLAKAIILRGKWDQPSCSNVNQQLQQRGDVVEEQGWIDEGTEKREMEASLWSVKRLLDSGAVVEARATLKRIQFFPFPIKSKKDVPSGSSQKDWRYMALSALSEEFRGTDPGLALSRVLAALSAIEGRKNGFFGVVPGSPGHELRSKLVCAKAQLLLDTGATIHDALQVVEVELLKTDLLQQPADVCGLICLKANLVAQQGGQFDKAISLFREAIRTDPTNAVAHEEAGWLHFTGGEEDDDSSGSSGIITSNPSSAMPLLEKSVELQGTPRQCYRLALCYWELGGIKKDDRSWCFTMLLRAAKQDPDGPFASRIFARLGLWYAEVGRDDVRSEGCFRKSLKLEPREELAGQYLVKILCSRGDVTEAVSLLKMSTSIDPRSHWAWAGLSRDCVRQWVWAVQANEGGRGGKEMIVDKDEEEQGGFLLAQAVGYMQQALKGSPGKWQYWSELGWLYLRKRMHASALKALQEALMRLEKMVNAQQSSSNLQDREIHKVAVLRVRTDIARVHCEIGQVDEAVSVIESALAFDSCNPVALMGAGECYLAQAHARSMEGLYYASYQSLQKGQRAMKALLDRQQELELKHGSKLVQAAWKLLGDLYIYCHKIPPSCCGGEGMGLGGWFSEQQKIIALSAEAYNEAKMAAVKTGERGDIAAAEYDTGLAFLFQAKARRLELGEGSGLWKIEEYSKQPDIFELLSKATSCFRASLLLDPTSCKAWVGLGCSSICDTSLQQHCFIRAVQIDHRNREAWMNLAVLYLCQGRFSEVYKALNVLQSIVVDHPMIWVLLGLLRLEQQDIQAAASPQNNTEMGIKEACDAFYTSLKVVQPLDGLLGLARTASSVESLQDGITAAEIYCDLNPGNPLAYTLLGLYLTDEEKFATAAECHCIALELIAMQRTLLGASFASSEAEQLVLSNLADAAAAGWAAASFPPNVYQDGGGVDQPQQHFFSLRVNNILKNPPAPFSCFSLAMFRLGLLVRGGKRSSCGDGFMAAALDQSKADDFNDDDDDSTPSRESTRMAFKVLLEYLSCNQVSSSIVPSSLLGVSLNSLRHDLAGTMQAVRNELRSISSSFLSCSADHISPPCYYHRPYYPQSGLETAKQLRTVAIALSVAGAPLSSSRKIVCCAIHLYPGSPLLWEELGSTLLREGPNDLRTIRLALYCGEAADKLVTSVHKDSEQRGLVYFRGTDGPFGYSSGRCESQCPAHMPAKVAARAINVKAVAGLAMGSSVKLSLRSLLKSLHICPGLPETWQALALALLGAYNLKDPADSDSDSCKGLINMGQQVFSIMGCDVEAKLCRALVGGVGENWVGTDDHLSQARWCACRGDEWGNAIEHYKQVLVDQSSIPLKNIAAVELSLCYEHCGKNNEAVECLRWAVGSLEESPFRSALLLHLAVALHRQGCNSESMEAVNDASRAIISNGLSSSILSFLRGVLWSGMKEKDSAKKAKNALNRVINEGNPCIPPRVVHAYLDTL